MNETTLYPWPRTFYRVHDLVDGHELGLFDNLDAALQEVEELQLHSWEIRNQHGNLVTNWREQPIGPFAD